MDFGQPLRYQMFFSLGTPIDVSLADVQRHELSRPEDVLMHTEAREYKHKGVRYIAMFYAGTRGISMVTTWKWDDFYGDKPTQPHKAYYRNW